MSSSRTPSWRTGVVTAINAGPPPTVTVNVGGDTANTVNAPYLDSYNPAVADTVQILVNQGAVIVIGTASGAGPIQTGSGTVTISAGSVSGTSGSITYPIGYPVAPVVVVMIDSTVGGVAGNFGARIVTRTTSSFTVTIFRTDGTVAPGGGNVAGYTWVATG